MKAMTVECDLVCPGCGHSMAVPLADMTPGRSRTCPRCGHLVTFAGQDAGRIQQVLDALGDVDGVDVQVKVEVKPARPWWKFW